MEYLQPTIGLFGLLLLGAAFSENIKATEVQDICDLMPKIKSIYDQLIRADVHNKWQ